MMKEEKEGEMEGRKRSSGEGTLKQEKKNIKEER